MKIAEFANSVYLDEVAHNEPPHLRSTLFAFLSLNSQYDVGWLVGFGFNGPLRQYFSLYGAVSQREGERGKKG